jgi:hypothetical protein
VPPARIRLKLDDLELETTQLSKEEFLNLLDVVREIQRSERVGDKLLKAGFSIKKPSEAPPSTD